MKPALKIGRNDPCPCGSGKKFKKCCEQSGADFSAPALVQGTEQRFEAAMLQGMRHKQRREFDEALAYFSRAGELEPHSAEAYMMCGLVYQEKGAVDTMIQYFQQALKIAPNNAKLHEDIGTALVVSARYAQAAAVLHRAVALKPDAEQAWEMLAVAEYQIGNDEVSACAYETLAQRFPHNTEARLCDAIFTPCIPMSNASIDANRARILNKLAELVAEGVRLKQPLKGLGTTQFYLLYQGRNHRDIAEPMANAVLKLCPELSFTAPYCRKPRKKPGEKLKLGFLSPSMHQPTINQFILKVMEMLEETGDFDITIFSSAPLRHPVVEEVKKRFPNYIGLPMDLEISQKVIADQNIDILINLEVGSQALMYCLQFARLAPLQIVWGGLPLTTGIPNADYYITARGAEPENAEQYYTEKLIYLSGSLSIMQEPEMPKVLKSRAELGLPEGDVRLYTCPVQLFKLHPDMDTIFADILKMDEKARIVLFDTGMSHWASQLKKRFALTMPPELCARIVFVPTLPRSDFSHALLQMDTVLDSVHFSFGTTAYICIGLGVPFVTWPGLLLCGRGCGPFMFNRMGLSELVASTHKDMASIAVKLANDQQYHESIAKRVYDTRHVVFKTENAVNEFAAEIKRIYHAT